MSEGAETRHFHGNILHDHPGGEVSHDHERRRHPARGWVIAAVILLAAYGVIRITTNEAAKNNPPAACQLLGGTWNIWNGWQCD
jgi:hypothetical protein